MTSAPLTPVLCHSCGGAVPLVEAAATPCPYCQAQVTIPADYLTAVAGRREIDRARRDAEPLWQRLSRPMPRWLGGAGLLLVVLLPPIVTLFANLIPYPPLSRAEICALFTIPGLLPGAWLWLWAGAVAATQTRFRDQLAAAPPQRENGPPECRVCAAPLEVPAGAIAASCLYCGSDSLVETIPLAAITSERRQIIRSLAEASAKLRSRRLMLGLGIATILLFVGGSSGLIWYAVTAAL